MVWGYSPKRLIIRHGHHTRLRHQIAQRRAYILLRRPVRIVCRTVLGTGAMRGTGVGDDLGPVAGGLVAA